MSHSWHNHGTKIIVSCRIRKCPNASFHNYVIISIFAEKELTDMESMTWLELLSIIIGTNGLTGLIVSIVTLKYAKSKAKSEAKSAEAGAQGAQAEADMKRQDYYQEIIEDMEKDRQRMKLVRDEQEAYINELKDDLKRRKEEKEMLRKENSELQHTIDELRNTQRAQGDEIAMLRRLYEGLKPLVCTNINCQTRQSVVMGLVADDSFDAVEEAKKECQK